MTNPQGYKIGFISSGYLNQQKLWFYPCAKIFGEPLMGVTHFSSGTITHLVVQIKSKPITFHHFEQWRDGWCKAGLKEATHTY